MEAREIEASDPRFVRKERQHIEVLRKRLDHLLSSHNHPERSSDPGYPAGEGNALAWVLNLLEGGIDPVHVRIERLEFKLKKIESRLGRVEHELAEEDE